MNNKKKLEISPGIDKIDAYMVPPRNFIHDSYYVNGRGPFHQTTGYAYRDNYGPSEYMGVQKRSYRATGEGYLIDSCGSSVGKSDE